MHKLMTALLAIALAAQAVWSWIDRGDIRFEQFRNRVDLVQMDVETAELNLEHVKLNEETIKAHAEEIEKLGHTVMWLRALDTADAKAYRQGRVFWCNRGIEVPPFLCSTLTEEERTRD